MHYLGFHGEFATVNSKTPRMIVHDTFAIIRDVVSFATLTFVVGILPFLDDIVPFDFHVIVPIRSVVFMV